MSSPENPPLPPQSETPDLSGLAHDPQSSPETFMAAPVSFPLIPEPARPRDPVWTGWDVLVIALMTIGTIFVFELLTITGAWLLLRSHETFRDVMQKPALDLLGEFLAYIAVAAFMVMLVESKYGVRFWKAIHWNWPSPGTRVLVLGLLGMFTISLDLIGRYLPMPKTSPFDEFFAHPRDAYLIAAFAVTLGPLMEELFFRGFLYPVLARRTGMISAVLLTALPFGMMHYLQYRSWAAVLVITLVGIVLTAVRALTESVAASFIVHVGYNATLMMLAAIATDGFRHMDKVSVILSRG